jgi:1,2-diacylglycerol 3-alpha-glucosyltransferase
MKVVFTHTDLRIYWPGRLEALFVFLHTKGIVLTIVEIAGAGSHYDFATNQLALPAYWQCLFPDRKIEEIPSYLANKILRKKLDELQPDIVFSGAIAYPSGAAAVRWAVDNNKKSVIFDNAQLKDVPRGWIPDYIKKKIYSAVDAVFCPAPSWNETFRYFGFTDIQIFHGLNVVDNSFWKKVADTQINTHPMKYLLSVARQIPEKNFRFLLNAYHKYLLVSPDPLHIVLVGDGPEHDLLKVIVQEKGFERFCHFYPFMSQEKLITFFHEAAWFILPSLKETWGLVVNEAMASRLPILASNLVGCASTLVEDGINGFNFSPYDESRLIELLLQASEMKENRRIEMGKRSEEIISDWDLDRFCNGTYNAIKFVSVSRKRPLDIISKILIKIWKGRYRPI